MYELASGALTAGGQVVDRKYHLSELPVFVRGGSILPQIPVVTGDTLGLAARQWDAVTWTVFPGSDRGSYSMYEDDGQTLNYLDGQAAWTTANYSRVKGATNVHIETVGAFPELPLERSYTIRLVNSLPPSKVVVDGGAPLPFSRWGGEGSWSYDGPSLTTEIRLKRGPLAPHVVEVAATHVAAYDLSGLKGKMAHAAWSKANLDETRVTPGAHTPDPAGAPLSDVASSGDALSFLAGQEAASFGAALAAIDTRFQSAHFELRQLCQSIGDKCCALNPQACAEFKQTPAVVERALGIADGNAAVVAPCNASSATQAWDWSAGMVQLRSQTTQCLSVANYLVADGSPAEEWACHPSDTSPEHQNQQWALDAAGHITSTGTASGMRLSFTDYNTGLVSVYIATSSDSPNQLWAYDASTGAIKSLQTAFASDLCLDAPAATPSKINPARLAYSLELLDGAA